MARIVGVHGIRQEYTGGPLLEQDWLPALQSGIALVTGVKIGGHDFTCAFYGDLFRRKGTMGLGPPPYTAADVNTDLERALLEALWLETVRVEGLPGPDSTTMLPRTPQSIQRALRVLTNSSFFSHVGERVLVFYLKQVSSYLTDQSIHDAIQDRVAAAVADDTSVLIGHSLGSVVAYEALCAHPEWQVHTFITLGSPLGIPNLVFDRLRPLPRNGKGVWPCRVAQWTNIADRGDTVALVKDLAPLFDGTIEDVRIHNGASAHSVVRYLTTEEAGRAVAAGLMR